MKSNLFAFFYFLILVTSCKGQGDNDDKFNDKFLVGQITNLNDFFSLNKYEKYLDSINNTFDKSIDSLLKKDTTQVVINKKDFFNNRSRFLLTEFANGVETTEDRMGEDGFSTECGCGIFKDTLFIDSGIGFFGGTGISIKVFNNHFRSSFYKYIDNVKPYKLTLTSEYTDYIFVESKYQFLQFDKQPNFKTGQKLTGYLTFTSKDFYESRFGEGLDTNFVKGTMRFTCLTKDIIDRH
jgi:hypothetical protein